MTATDRYRHDGYALPFRAISAEEAGSCVERFGALRARTEEAFGTWIKSDLHLVEPWLYDLVSAPAVLDVVETILGPDILCWEADLFPKSPHDPGFISWHQDGTYFGLQPADGVLTAWIALTDSRPDNGCMRVIPGTHLTGDLDHEETFAADNLLSRGQAVALDADAVGGAVDLELSPGEFSLHHVRIVHGSQANTSDRPRIGLAVRYVAGNVTTESAGDPVLCVRGVPRSKAFRVLEPPRESFGAAERERFLAVREMRAASSG